MKPQRSGIFNTLHRMWRSLDPQVSVAEEVLLNQIDDETFELSWLGTPFVIDRRRKVIFRRGQAETAFDAIRTIDVSHIRTPDEADRWSVSLCLGAWTSIAVGTTYDDANASIAGAKLSTLVGKPVRAL